MRQSQVVCNHVGMTKSGAGEPLPDDVTFAVNVKKLRERRGWSMNDLAERLQEEGLGNFHPTTVSRVESGQRSVRVGEVAAFEKALASSLAYMLQPADDVKLVNDLLLQLQEFRGQMSGYVDATRSLLAMVDEIKETQTHLRKTLTGLDEHWEQVEAAGWGKGIEIQIEGARELADLDLVELTVEEVQSHYGVDK